jgi:hypothetical protein
VDLALATAMLMEAAVEGTVEAKGRPREPRTSS